MSELAARSLRFEALVGRRRDERILRSMRGLVREGSWSWALAVVKVWGGGSVVSAIEESRTRDDICSRRSTDP